MGRSLPVVDCVGCGGCCLEVGHPGFFWNPATGGGVDPLWFSLPAALRSELEVYLDGLAEPDLGKTCVWFDPDLRRCRHYDYRPQMCRDFEVGNPKCVQLFEQHGRRELGSG